MTQLDPIIAKETPPLFWLSGFEGVNLHDDRRSIGDEECSWLENFAPLGKGNARSMYDNAVSIYTASGLTIVYVDRERIDASIPMIDGDSSSQHALPAPEFVDVEVVKEVPRGK